MNPVKITSISQVFNDIPDDKIRILHLNINEQMIVINYINCNYPRLYKISLTSEIFARELLHTFIKCYECGCGVFIDDYHRGYLENNKDEWRSGTCQRCNTYITFEVNYDDWDDLVFIWERNIIAFGPWFKDYIKHNIVTFGSLSEDHTKSDHIEEADITCEKIMDVLIGKSFYEISTPTGKHNKKTITEYIDSKLQ